MTETILVGVDGSAPSRVALRWSVKRANAIGAQLSLAHVVDDEWATIGTRMLDELRAEAQRLVEEEANYARSLASDLVVHAQLLHGSPMQELASASKSEHIVAVGTHKTGFINGKVFGSRSLWLAAAAQVPVAIIPQTSRRDGRGIVVGVDDSAAARRAIQFAAKEAERARESLTLLRAFTVPLLPGEDDEIQPELTRHAEAHTAAMLSDAVTLVDLVAPTVEVRIRSVHRRAAEALLDALASSALLVIGDSRRNDAGLTMVGSVSHDVLINLTGPAIIVHAKDPQ